MTFQKPVLKFHSSCYIRIKGTVSRDFLLLVFFMNQFPPSSRVFHLDRFEFFRKLRRYSRVNDTGGKFATGVNDTGGKIAAGVNDAGGKFRYRWQIFPPFSLALLIPVANLPLVSTTPVANCHRYQRHRRQICRRCR
jgi:hypothetical protein